MTLLGEPVRITTEDKIELNGMLFESAKRKDKAIIHVHGWCGNFYENMFIDFIAREAISRGFAFLTFNTRGVGFISDLIERKKVNFEYVRIGGSLEKFEDCIKDIKASIDFLVKRGYKKIILQGHSSGCQKITYYKFKTRDKRVKGLIELSPADDVAVTKKLLGNRYEEAIRIAKKMVRTDRGDKPVPEWMAYYPLLIAKTFLTVSTPKSSSGRIFYYDGKLKEIKNVNCPILAIFGSKDKYQENPKEKLQILKRNVKNCDTFLINDATHSFAGFEAKLSKIVGDWIKV